MNFKLQSVDDFFVVA